MEQKYLIEVEEEEVKEESVPITVLKWFVKNLKFIAVPTSTYEELRLKEQEYEKTKSQRKFIRKLKSVLTLIGLVIVLGLATIAVFPHWISPYTFLEANGLYKVPARWAECSSEKNLFSVRRFFEEARRPPPLASCECIAHNQVRSRKEIPTTPLCDSVSNS